MANPNSLDLLVSAFTKGVVSPLNNFGLGGFVFDIEGESQVTLTADIPDHWLEDNTTVQDHIAIKPKKVVLKSYVGELVDLQDPESNTPVQKVVQKMTVLTSFLPALTKAATQATELVRDTRLSDISLSNVTLESINKTVDYWGLVKNLSTSESRQQEAYQYFKTMMEQRVLVSVQTPFEFMTNMAIESVIGIQPERSKFITDFSITLKQIRTVSIMNAAFDAEKFSVSEGTPEDLFQGRTFDQRAPLENVGNMEGLIEPGYNLDDLMTDDMYNAPNPFPAPPVSP